MLHIPAPVENGGKHPIIYRVSTCLNMFQPSKLGGAGFRWPIRRSNNQNHPKPSILGKFH